MKLALLLFALKTSITYAQYVETVEKSFTVETFPFDMTNYDNTKSCGSIISDRIGGQCITWEALAALGENGNNNFGGWLVAGTKLNKSRDSVSINGAPTGFVPDLYYTYTGEIGGVLSSRRVKTTINIDRMDCLNPECTWIGDSRYVVDACGTLGNLESEGLTIDKGLTCHAQQWVFNKIRGTVLGVGRQLALDSNITNNIVQNNALKLVDVSRNIRVQSLVGENSLLFDVHYIRYYKDDNRTSFETQEDFRVEDPMRSLKDSTMHAILRKLYNGRSAPVIRAIEIDGTCKLVVVNSNHCNGPQIPTPVYDNCQYNASAPVRSLLISRYDFNNMIMGELYELKTGGFLTEKTINATENPVGGMGSLGFNTSMIYKLGLIPFLSLNMGIPQMENATKLVDLAVEYPVACFDNRKIKSKECATFNMISSSISEPFKIVEFENDLWLEVNMSNPDNFFAPFIVQNINWDEVFDFLNRQTGCTYFVVPDSFDGLKEVDRWHNAMETLVHVVKPNSLQPGFVEIKPGVQGDSCSKKGDVSLIEDTQYLADLVSQVTNNALQTVSPTLTSTSAIVSFILVILSFTALLMTLESRKTHNIAVFITAFALLASVGVLVGDNVNTRKQNDLFLNSAIIVEKVTNGNCETSSPLYISAITQSYVENDAANAVLWTAVGLLSMGIFVAIAYLVFKHYRNKPKP